MNAKRPIVCRTKTDHALTSGIFSLMFILACGCANEVPETANSKPVDPPESTANDETVSAVSTDDNSPTEENSSADKPREAVEKPQTSPPANPTVEDHADASPDRFARDLKYVPEYALAILVVRPAELLALPGVKNLPGADLAGLVSIKPSDVDRLVLTLLPDSTESVRFGFIVETHNAIPRQEIVKRLSPGARPYGNEGKIFLSASREYGRGLSLAFPDDETVLVANSTFALLQMLQSEKAENRATRILQAYAHNNHKSQISAAIDLDRLRHTMDTLWAREESEDGDVGAQNIVLRMPHTVKTAAFSWAVEKADGLTLRIDSQDDELTPVERAQFVHKLIEQQIDGFSRWQEATVVESLKNEAQLTNESLQAIVDQLEPATDGATARIRSNQMPAAAESVQLIARTMALVSASKRRERDTLITSHNLASLGLSIHNYLDSSGELPHDITSAEGKPLLSWRVRLLKYLDFKQRQFYEEFHLDEPWDSPHNKQLIARMPDAFRSRESKPGEHKTHLLAIDGKGTVFGDKIRQLDEITDGPANTLALVEAEDGVVWTKPADLPFDPEHPRAGLRPQGALAIFYDGSRAEILPATSDETLRHAYLFADGGDFSGESLAQKRSSRAYASKQLTEQEIEEILPVIRKGSREKRRAALFRLRINHIYGNQTLAQKVIDELVELVSTTDPNVRLWTLDVLNEWTRQGMVDWKKLDPVLDDPYDKNRWLAIRILGTTGEPKLVARLFDLPRQDSMDRNTALYVGLQDVAADACVPLLKSDDKVKKLNAIYLIASTGNMSHVADLKKLLDDEDEECRKAAKIAIDKLESSSK